jgi:hypothetical protein
LSWDDSEGNWFVDLNSVQQDVDEVLGGGGLGGGEVHDVSSVPVSLADDYGNALIAWVRGLIISN